MAATVPNEGENRMLTEAKGMSNQRVVLFTNNITPGPTTTYSGLTLATFSGYSAVTPSWGSASTDGSGYGSAAAAAAVFAHNGGGTSNNVYGWALVDITGGSEKILAAERLASPPKAMTLSGDSITITLTWKMLEKDS